MVQKLISVRPQAAAILDARKKQTQSYSDVIIEMEQEIKNARTALQFVHKV